METDFIKQSTPLKWTVIALYILIMIVGVIGNLLIIYAVTSRKHMQSVINILITNLAVADFLNCVINVPMTPTSYFVSWIFGEAMCHVFPMMMCAFVYVSTLTCVVMSIVRYRVVIYPLKSKMTKSACTIVILCIWFIAIAASLPLGIYTNVSKHEDGSVNCIENWSHKEVRQAFSWTSLSLQYLLPCCVMYYCYSRIAKFLRKRSQEIIGEPCLLRLTFDSQIEKNKRTNKLLIAVIVTFVCCWLPLNICLICTEYQSNLNQEPYYTVIFFSCHILAMSSTSYNIFLYAYLNEKFRNAFQQVWVSLSGLLRCHCVCRKDLA